jgi:hypothetical protein
MNSNPTRPGASIRSAQAAGVSFQADARENTSDTCQTQGDLTIVRETLGAFCAKLSKSDDIRRRTRTASLFRAGRCPKVPTALRRVGAKTSWPRVQNGGA